MLDDNHTISFYGNKEFNGSLAEATVYVKDGKVIGIYDYHDYDRKLWFGENKRKNVFAEIATRIGDSSKGKPFHIYGGMVKKKY